MSAKYVDIGSGQRWATAHGVDSNYLALLKFMRRVTLAEFVDLVQSVDKQVPDGVEKNAFMQHYANVQQLPAKTINQVLLHPLSIYWVRSTRQILRSINRQVPLINFWYGHLSRDNSGVAVDPKTLLSGAMAHFSHVDLAAHILSEKEVELDVAIGLDGFLAIPSTGLSIKVLPPSEITRMISIQLQKTGGDNNFTLLIPLSKQSKISVDLTVQNNEVQPNDPLHSLKKITTPGRGIELDNCDPRFLNNWVTAEIYSRNLEVIPAPNDTLPEWTKLLHDAFDILDKSNLPLAQEIRSVIRTIIPVMSLNPTVQVSCSNRDYWGAVQCSLRSAMAFSDVLAHEYRHNILNAVMEVDPILDENAPSGNVFYSPWRTDKRPLIGLLHAIYSFTEVVSYYQIYLDTHTEISKEDVNQAQSEIAVNVYRLRVGAELFARHAKLTQFGEELFEGLQKRIDDLESYLPNIASEIKFSAQQATEKHRAAWENT